YCVRLVGSEMCIRDRYFKDHTVQENNIVQTIASAAGTLSAIIFVLPGLIMVGWWSGFPYWTTAALCALGGILGVTYSIPLRRALVTGSDLAFPEGVAAAEVLKVGDTSEGAADNRRGLHVIIWGAISSAFFSLLTNLKIALSSVTTAFKVGAGGTMVGTSLSLALIGIGHLVGLGVGIAMVCGMVISYGVLLPYFSSGQLGTGDIAEGVQGIFASDVRFVGAGTIAIAAIWTFIKIIAPIIRGMRESLAASRRRKAGVNVPAQERDLSLGWVVGITLALMIPIGLLLWLFLKGTPLEHHTGGLIFLSILFILALGLAVASVCGYMAGLIGSSNSPVSGVGILVAIVTALVIKAAVPAGSDPKTLVAYTLFTAAIVFGIATISNDNLQDLKTGQLVNSTPWKQQVALIIGVIFGSLIIPPVLHLMNNAFGFQGAPGAGKNALAAPQASLIAELTKGVFGGDIDWSLLGLGALIGVAIILIDEILKHATSRYSLPPIAVGMGMYLPITLTILIPIGATCGVLFNRWAKTRKNPEAASRMGTLLATGLIVGESLWGVVYAAIVGTTGCEEPLAIVPDSWSGVSSLVGLVIFVALATWGYRRAKQQAEA
ncbi:OPT family oligopeptide transporter, partial [uncultured Varibaculum sp.]|uniref:OPT family oligopeptide transporter n=1 Tax=uncultured Varibaculum sp. TaxID=413896 RepID=UPI0025970997